jgi:hypothetical protein
VWNAALAGRERMAKLTEKTQDKLSDGTLLLLMAGGDEKSCQRRKHEKIILLITFEAGMCVKTKDHKTQCPNKNRHLGLNLRHLRGTDVDFA